MEPHAHEHWETLEGLRRRFDLPLVPEYELEDLRRLRHRELRLRLAQTDAALRGGARADLLARRGRLRRLLGDAAGAAEDLTRALDRAPGLADAHCWLGELGLAGAEGERSLSRAIALDPRLAAALLYRGAARLLHGRAEQAREDLRRAARLAPRSGLAALLLGVAEERLGARRRAAAAYRESARRNPDCAAAHWLRSRCEDDPRRAAAIGEAALDADPSYALIAASFYKPGMAWPALISKVRRFALERPGDVNAYISEEGLFAPLPREDRAGAARLRAARPAAWSAALAGRSVLRSPRSDRPSSGGRRDIEDALRRAPGRGWIYAWRALAWLQEGRRDRALRDLDRCARTQPYYVRTYAWRGALLRAAGRFPEALRDLDVAVAMDPVYAFAWNERSRARRGAGDWLGAAADLDRAFLLDFRHRWVYVADRETSDAEWERGLAELDRGLRAHPQDPSLRAWRGQWMWCRNRLPEALAELARAASLDPHHAIAHAWLGFVLNASGQPARAVDALRRAAALEPRAVVFRAWLAEATAARGDARRGLGLLRETLREHPRSWWLRARLAEMHLEGGRPRDALAEVRKAIRAEGRHADAYHLLARARLALNDPRGALGAVDEALRLSPHLGRAYLLRARALQSLGRAESAVRDYRTAYERFPYLFNEEQRTSMRALLAGPPARRPEARA